MALKIDAKPVIMSFTHITKDKAAQLGNFLKAANSSGLQSPAIVSYFTELNKVSDNKHLLSKGAADRFDKLIDLIDQEVKSNPDLKKESDTFVSTLTKAYPKTLDKRISIASQGAVRSDRIEPKSRFSKLMVFLNQLLTD